MQPVATNDLENVVEAFQNLQFHPGLKQSRVEEFRGLHVIIRNKGERARAALIKLNNGFSRVAERYFFNHVVDESMVGRNEYRVKCRGNRALAYVGDAYLSYFLARQCLERGYVPEEFQRNRTAFTSNAHLTFISDMLWGPDPLLHWDPTGKSSPSPKQKGAAVEALIGVMCQCKFMDLADWICEFILSHRSESAELHLNAGM